MIPPFILKNLAESFIDNTLRDTVQKPVSGSVVYCELCFGKAEHTGIVINSNEIIHQQKFIRIRGEYGKEISF